ncbi:uncharacterized protein TNCV_1338431 [Trichonephila clavipes]|nr:uncharacterized protein TNCV_1338431 [Trichonephila clavipes]
MRGNRHFLRNRIGHDRIGKYSTLQSCLRFACKRFVATTLGLGKMLLLAEYLEGEKDFNDDHREEFTDFVQSIPVYLECDEEDIETWMACDAEDCGNQMLNDDDIVTFVQEDPTLSTMKRMKTRTTTTTKVAKGPSNADAFSALETAMERHMCEWMESPESSHSLKECVNISFPLFSYMKTFGDVLRNFEPWSSDEDDT